MLVFYSSYTSLFIRFERAILAHIKHAPMIIKTMPLSIIPNDASTNLVKIIVPIINIPALVTPNCFSLIPVRTQIIPKYNTYRLNIHTAMCLAVISAFLLSAAGCNKSTSVKSDKKGFEILFHLVPREVVVYKRCCNRHDVFSLVYFVLRGA